MSLVKIENPYKENAFQGDIRDIALLGDPILRQQAQTVTDVHIPHVRQTIADMHKTLSISHGVGIAAPQIAVSLRIVIIASRPTPRYPTAPEMSPVVMINPKYEIVDPQLKKDWEGCLSIPGIRARVARYLAIRVNYQDEQGKQRQKLLEDFPARIFQHEFDHLNGLVYLDRVQDNRDIVTESEFQKLFH